MNCLRDDGISILLLHPHLRQCQAFALERQEENAARQVLWSAVRQLTGRTPKNLMLHPVI
jgi:hypothetical protein